MQGKRGERVGHLLQKELSQLIIERVKDPRIGFITITHVKMAPDMKSAVIFFSVMGDDAKKKESLKTLERSTGFLQREIGHALNLRYTPRLHWEIDDSLEEGLKIDKVLRDLEKENG